MTMATALLTCVYPGAEGFVPEFIASLKGQSRKDFTLVVLNDDVAGCDMLFKNSTITTQIIVVEGTPAKIRKAGIKWISRNGFDLVIFADIDDRFKANRVERSISLLEDSILVFNELVLFGAGIIGEEPMYADRFSEGERIRVDSLVTSNCLGLSNTAAHVNQIFEAIQNTSDDVVAFDWALFTRVLTAGETALFTSKTCTYYRQHGANLAVTRTLTDQDIRRGVTVKARHYSAVSDLGPQFQDLAVSFAKLDAKINAEPDFAALYYSAVRAKAPAKPLWWETIRTAKELNI